jgi:hypothetical protein
MNRAPSSNNNWANPGMEVFANAGAVNLINAHLHVLVGGDYILIHHHHHPTHSVPTQAPATQADQTPNDPGQEEAEVATLGQNTQR